MVTMAVEDDDGNDDDDDDKDDDDDGGGGDDGVYGRCLQCFVYSRLIVVVHSHVCRCQIVVWRPPIDEQLPSGYIDMLYRHIYTCILSVWICV